ncbi:MAG TPA: extracellular solute-binding protein, partial [bacterium]|nr:extracellular solute-binding protein [bacterium]
MKKLNSFLLRLLFIIAFFSFAANYGLYAAEKKIIKLWTFWEQDLFQDGIDVFLKNNPDYEIEYQQLSWASGKDKIVTAVAGGAEPDIIELGSTWMAEFMEYNSLADITGFPEKEDYVGGFESAANNGRIYGLPLFGSVNIIYYNKTLFKRANIISVPKTLNELLKCSEKIKKLGNDYFGFSIKISSKITTWQKFVPFLWTFNGKILSDDFSNVLITSPEIISSFEYYYKLSKTSYIGTQDSARQAFYMGKLGMIFDGPGLDLDQKAPGLEWDYFLIPGLTGSQLGKSFTGVDYLAVFAGSSHKIKSVELMDILAEKCKISDKIKTLLPFHKNNLDNYLKKYPQGFFYAEQLKNSMTSQPYANWESLMEVLNYGIESVVLNRSPVKEAIVKTQKEMTDIINSHKIQGGKINMRFIDFVIWGAGLLFTLWLIIKIRNRSVISFLSPWIISFILFSLYPVLHSIFVSFTNYNPLTADNVFFINFKNYLEIVKDGHFIAAFKNTLIFTGISIPVTVSIALILAVFLNENIAFKRLFRASFFFPVITSVIVIA